MMCAGVREATVEGWDVPCSVSAYDRKGGVPVCKEEGFSEEFGGTQRSQATSGPQSLSALVRSGVSKTRAPPLEVPAP